MRILQLMVISALGSGCGKQDTKERDLIEEGKFAGKWLAEKAEQESDSYTAQKAKLDKAVEEAQSLIEDGQLDRAEAKLADIHWTPRSQGLLSESDKKLIQIYDDKRTTLRGVIDRKRK